MQVEAKNFSQATDSNSCFTIYKQIGKSWKETTSRPYQLSKNIPDETNECRLKAT